MDLKIQLKRSKPDSKEIKTEKNQNNLIDINQYLFEFSPISIWEEDFSEAKLFIDELTEQGVTDFRKHFDENEDDLFIISGLIKVLNINQETLKMFGVSSKEEIPLNLPKYFTEDSLPVFKEEVLAFISGETTFESPIPIQSLEGVQMILDIKASILPGFEDTWDKVLVSFVDVTKQKEAERALKQREIELLESNQAKDKLFNIIAHDLRGPMNAILGFSELLKDDNDSTLEPKQRTKMLDYIYQSAKSSYGLFENLLTWSRSKVGTILFDPQPQKLNEICDKCVDLLKHSAAVKKIHVQNSLPKNLNAHVDVNMMSTVFRNLISNAIKFTPPNGDVIIELQNNKEDDFLEITISDSGVGIKKERLQSLFSVGESKSTKGTNNESGTGLGLIICKEFVEKHDGKIWIESIEKRSTTVHFTLPR